jgi:hypothetical protein
LRLVVAHPLNEAAAIDIPALERRKIDGAAISHLDRFGANLRGEQVQEQGCCGSDHGARKLSALGEGGKWPGYGYRGLLAIINSARVLMDKQAETRGNHTSLDSIGTSR